MGKPLEIIQLQQAIPLLECEYTTDGHNRVTELELFEPEYTELENFNQGFEVIRNFDKLKKLIVAVTGFSNLGPLEALRELEYFEAGESEITSVKPLEGLVKLRHLGLFLNRIADIEPLRHLTELEHINLSCNNITDIAALSGMEGLKQLYLSHNTISSVVPLQHTRQLHSLTLNNNLLRDVSAIAGNTGLTVLNVSHNAISGLDFARAFTALENLDIASNAITDVSFISTLTGLKYLTLSDNKVTDITALAALKNGKMHTLKLSGNTITDASPVAHLTGLEHFGVGHNPVADVAFVSRFKKLEQLDLDGVLHHNYALLNGMDNLRVLSLKNNNIANAALLPDLKNLHTLGLSGNAVEDVMPFLRYKELSFLDLSHNNIVNPAPLVWMQKLSTLNVTGNPVGHPHFDAVFADHYNGYDGVIRQKHEVLNLAAGQYYLQLKEYDWALAHFLLPPSRYNTAVTPGLDRGAGLLEVFYHKFMETHPDDHYYFKFYFIKCLGLINAGNILVAQRDFKENLVARIKALPDGEALAQSLINRQSYSYSTMQEYWKATVDSNTINKQENPVALYEAAQNLNRDELDYGISNYRRLVHLRHPLQYTLRRVLIDTMNRTFAYTDAERQAYRRTLAKLDEDNLVPLFERFGFTRQRKPAASRPAPVNVPYEEPFAVRLFYGVVKLVFVIALIAALYFTLRIVQHSGGR